MMTRRIASGILLPSPPRQNGRRPVTMCTGPKDSPPMRILVRNTLKGVLPSNGQINGLEPQLNPVFIWSWPKKLWGQPLPFSIDLVWSLHHDQPEEEYTLLPARAKRGRAHFHCHVALFTFEYNYCNFCWFRSRPSIPDRNQLPSEE